MPFCKHCGRTLIEGEICSCTQQNQSNNFGSQQNESFEHQENQNFQQQNYQQYSQQPFNPNNQVQYAQTVDFTSYLSFLKDYFVRPNSASAYFATQNEKASIIISAALAFLSILLSKVTMLAKASCFKGTVFIFAILYFIILFILPFGLNAMMMALNKRQINSKNLSREIILHTNFMSLMLLCSFLFGFASLFLRELFVIIAIIAYLAGQIATFQRNVKPIDSIWKKTILVVMILICLSIVSGVFATEVASYVKDVLVLFLDSISSIFNLL